MWALLALQDTTDSRYRLQKYIFCYFLTCHSATRANVFRLLPLRNPAPNTPSLAGRTKGLEIDS